MKRMVMVKVTYEDLAKFLELPEGYIVKAVLSTMEDMVQERMGVFIAGPKCPPVLSMGSVMVMDLQKLIKEVEEDGVDK